MTTPQSLGTRIRRARERKRWTQQQLADALGVSLRTVGDWERGKAAPRNSIGALEAVLGVSFDEEEARPRIPPNIEAAIARSGLDQEFQDEFRRALEEVIRRRKGGDPDVTLHGPLVPPPPSSSGEAHDGVLTGSPALPLPPLRIPAPEDLPG